MAVYAVSIRPAQEADRRALAQLLVDVGELWDLIDMGLLLGPGK